MLDRYSPSPAVTDSILELFCDTLHLNLDLEGDNNAQLGFYLFINSKLAGPN